MLSAAINWWKRCPLWQKKGHLSRKYYVRSIQDQDIPALMAIERVIYSGRLQWTKRTFERELHNSIPHLYLLIEQEGKIVGFIGSRFEKGRAHITNLAILPSYQRQGLAHLLIKKVEWKARLYHCRKMSLEVRTSNMLAQKLYRSLGFKAVKFLKAYYLDNGEDAIYMEKKI